MSQEAPLCPLPCLLIVPSRLRVSRRRASDCDDQGVWRIDAGYAEEEKEDYDFFASTVRDVRLRRARSAYHICDINGSQEKGRRLICMNAAGSLAHVKHIIFVISRREKAQHITAETSSLQSTRARWRGENQLHPDHLLLDSAPNLGPFISRWEITKFESYWYKSVRILQVLKLLFQQFLNLSSSQRDMSGPILGALSNNRCSWGSFKIRSYLQTPRSDVLKCMQQLWI